MIEYSNIMGKRFVATANGPEEFRDLRALGCPANIAARVEQRSAARPAPRKRSTPPALTWDEERTLLAKALVQSNDIYADSVKRYDDVRFAEIAHPRLSGPPSL